MKPNMASAAIWIATMLMTVLANTVLAAPATAAKTEPELLEAEKAFQLSGRMRDDRTIEINYLVADGYYMYRDRFRFTVNGEPIKLAARQFPPGKMKQDATFGKVITYRNSVRILLPVSMSGNKTTSSSGSELVLKVTSQGCADAGVCYPPQHQLLALVRGSSAIAMPGETTAGNFSRPANAAGPVSDLLKRN